MISNPKTLVDHINNLSERVGVEIKSVKKIAEDALNNGGSLDPSKYLTFQEALNIYVSKEELQSYSINYAGVFNSILDSKKLNYSAPKTYNVSSSLTPSASPSSGFLTKEDGELLFMLKTEINYDFANEFKRIFGA